MNQKPDEAGKLAASTVSVELTYDRHACLCKAIDQSKRQEIDVGDVDQEALRGSVVRQFDLKYAFDSAVPPEEANVRGATLWLRQHGFAAAVDMVVTAERAEDDEAVELQLTVDVPLSALPVLDKEIVLFPERLPQSQGQTDVHREWLKGLKKGDRVEVPFSLSQEDIKPMTVVKNDGAWIRLLPDGVPDRAEHLMTVCAASGNVLHTGARIVPIGTVIPMESARAIEDDGKPGKIGDSSVDGWSLKVFNADCGVWQVFGAGSRAECEAQATSVGKAIERVDERRRVIFAD